VSVCRRLIVSALEVFSFKVIILFTAIALHAPPHLQAVGVQECLDILLDWKVVFSLILLLPFIPALLWLMNVFSCSNMKVSLSLI